MPSLLRSADGGNGRFPLGVGSILHGLGVTFLAALAFSVSVGLGVALTPAWDAPDALLNGLNLLAVGAGGFAAGRRARRLGWLHGGLVGVVYLLLVSWMLAPGEAMEAVATAAGLKTAAYGFLAGALGGVLGVAA
ncbi:MAG TPA: TIGR04086 family membrane protein [Limnochordales bacterium]